MKKLTPENVAAFVEVLRGMAGDDEIAHSEEDKMRHIVLKAIAEGRCDDPQGCAEEALKSSDIEFARYTS